MSPRRIIFLIVALVAAGATILLGRAWLAAQKQVQPTVVQAPEAPKAMVMVARGDLKVGQFIRPENLRFQAWPEEGVSQSYITSEKNSQDDFKGWAVRSAMHDGEPVTMDRIVSPKGGGFLAAVLRPGYRAVTVAVSPSSGISGLVFPGDYIDLIATMKLVDKTQKEKVDHQASETVLTNLRVLSLDTRLDDVSQGKEAKDIQIPRTATLEVTPKQAEIVAVVNEVGKLSLSLRSLTTDEAAAMASNDDSGALSYTFDSDATKLIEPPGNNQGRAQVVIYKGGTPYVVDFIGGRASGLTNPPPKDSQNDEDH